MTSSLKAPSLNCYLFVLFIFSLCFFTTLISENAKFEESTENVAQNPVTEFNSWVNGFVLSPAITNSIKATLGDEGGHYFSCYLRDLLIGSFLYYSVAGIWHICIFTIYGAELFTNKGLKMPDAAAIRSHILLAQSSLFIYAMLPVLSEYIIANGYTKCYYYLDEVGGWGPYFAYLIAYLSLVEVGVYWMHRTLHTSKPLYKYIHGLHHSFNSQATLSPWASIAFNPFDGILQASPYLLALFIVPCHYLTHLVLVFFTAVWATNIHDTVTSGSNFVMGAKYHTIHHTHYHYNFGQFFVVCDYIWGSLRGPDDLKSE